MANTDGVFAGYRGGETPRTCATGSCRWSSTPARIWWSSSTRRHQPADGSAEARGPAGRIRDPAGRGRTTRTGSRFRRCSTRRRQGEKRAGLETLAFGDDGRTDVFLTGGPIATTTGRILGSGSRRPLRRRAGDRSAGADGRDDLDLRSAGRRCWPARMGRPRPQTRRCRKTPLTLLDLRRRGAEPGSEPDDRGDALRRGADAPGRARWRGLPRLPRGSRLPEATVTSSGGPDPGVVVALSALALLLVVIIGLLISNSITRPLVRMADVSTAVATGDLEARVPVEGSDEISVLAGTFNRMVEGLREGLIYHDLLGRAVTPEVREELRRSLSDGARAASVQATRATVLVAGLRGVGTERAPARSGQGHGLAQRVLRRAWCPWSHITAASSTVSMGTSPLPCSGLLPKPSPAPVGAMQATHAALRVDGVGRAPQRPAGPTPGSAGCLWAWPWRPAGSSPVDWGRGIGSSTPSSARRSTPPWKWNGSCGRRRPEGLVVNGGAYKALGGARSHFQFGRHGQAQVRGLAAPLEIHEVIGRSRRLLEAGGRGFLRRHDGLAWSGPPRDAGLAVGVGLTAHIEPPGRASTFEGTRAGASQEALLWFPGGDGVSCHEGFRATVVDRSRRAFPVSAGRLGLAGVAAQLGPGRPTALRPAA